MRVLLVRHPSARVAVAVVAAACLVVLGRAADERDMREVFRRSDPPAPAGTPAASTRAFEYDPPDRWRT